MKTKSEGDSQAVERNPFPLVVEPSLFLHRSDRLRYGDASAGGSGFSSLAHAQGVRRRDRLRADHPRALSHHRHFHRLQSGGLLGSTLATVGMFYPSFFYTLVMTELYEKIKRNPWIRKALRSILAAFTGMLFFVVLSLGRVSLVSPATYIWAVGF